METITLKDHITTRMTDDEFFWFCQENKDLRIERNSNLEIIIMSPVTSLSGFWSMEIARQLANWNIIHKLGIVFDASTGFSLPDHSVLSPDASWVSKEKWSALSEEDKNRFAPLCPEFVIEVRSKSDHIDDLKKKMQTWIANGAELAWLVDPIEKNVYVFKPNQSEKLIQGFNQKIEGEGKLKSFVLDLSLIVI